MQRKSFLQHLTALGAFSFLPANAFKHYQKFYLLQCFVAGFKYYKGMELLPDMKQGDELELVREPANEYDECAIALHWNNEKIGFIPASDNVVLSRLLDAGALELSAEITHLNKQVQPWENLCIAIHFLKETTLGALPEHMEYLTALETPHYSSYKTGNNQVMRIAKNGREERVTDWAKFLVDNSKNDSIYDIIMNSQVNPSYAYGSETGEYLLLNKKRLKDNPALKEIFAKAEETIGSIDNLFKEDGFITVTTDEIAALVPQIENLVNVTDKLGRLFIELQF